MKIIESNPGSLAIKIDESFGKHVLIGMLGRGCEYLMCSECDCMPFIFGVPITEFMEEMEDIVHA